MNKPYRKSQKRTAKTKSTQERVTIGMDLGDKTSRYCMLNNEGEILRGASHDYQSRNGGRVWVLRTNADRHRSRDPLALGEPFVAKVGA
jgi:activator of 2-hydroxyglutaryl-CoA dehydratase